MPRKNLTIDSVQGGWSATQYAYRKGEFLASIAIDPDMPISDSDIRTSGLLIPVQYEKFSGSNISGFPKWMVTSQKDTKIYVYNSDGKFVSYTSSLGSETLIGTPTSGAGNGAAYYNNYIYLATPTDISRYGPLDGVPTLVDNVWTGATLGAQVALTNTTYPTLQGTTIPNHPMHQHGGFLYVGDVLPASNAAPAKGVIHQIATKKGAVQGDTDNDSLYDVLELPFGFFPTDIESYGTDLIISAIQTTDSTLNQGKAKLFLWDTLSDTFYRQVSIADPIITSLMNMNGTVYAWSGNAQNGYRLSYYAGGDTMRDVEYFEEGTPPLAGAVDALGNRLIWGSSTTYPVSSASVFSYGSKNSSINQGLQNVVKTTASGGTPTVSAIKYVQQSSNIIPKIITGWGTGASYGIDKYSTTQTLASVWRSELFPIGTKFNVVELRLPFAASVAAGMTLTTKVFIDDGSSSVTLPTIDTTNFSGSRKVIFKELDLQQTTGFNNLFIELNWTGTVKLPVALPIEIVVDIYTDDKRS